MNQDSLATTYRRRVDRSSILVGNADLDVILVSEDQLVGLRIGEGLHLEAVRRRDADGSKLHNLAFRVLDEELRER